MRTPTLPQVACSGKGKGTEVRSRWDRLTPPGLAGVGGGGPARGRNQG